RDFHVTGVQTCALPISSFMRLNSIDPAGTPEEVAEAILFAFLASPSFLMRLELNQQVEGEALQLSSHEVASRLSFLLWGSTPDRSEERRVGQEWIHAHT